jgi:hypothetical protein
VRRTFAWLLTLTLTAAGMLAGHTAAYALVTEPSGLHEYLDHAPQVLLVLATLALAGLALTSRGATPAAWPFPVVALAGFGAQEHVERLAHTGEAPWLLTNPVFLVGLALQLPVAVAAWLLARLLLHTLASTPPRRPPRLSGLWLPVAAAVGASPATRAPDALRARGPPALFRPR